MITIINKIILALGCLPYVYWLLFYSYVIRAMLKLGRLPYYDHPDPKELNFNLHRAVIYKALEYCIYGIGLLIILSTVLFWMQKLNVTKKHWIFIIVGILFLFFHLIIDPFFGWVVD